MQLCCFTPQHKYTLIDFDQAVLALHGNKVTAMNHLDSELDEEVVEEEFRFPELLKRPVLQPFLIILVMMVLLQFSGQGAVTFYTAQIFKVGLQISRRPD